MSQDHRLKFRYRMLYIGIFVAGAILSFYPTWVISLYIAGLMGIPENVPVKDQENGFLWMAIMLVILFVNIFLGSVVVAKAVGKYNGWSREHQADLFIRGRYPAHWLHPESVHK